MEHLQNTNGRLLKKDAKVGLLLEKQTGFIKVEKKEQQMTEIEL